MGFFSWKTSDTGRSIANHFSSRDTFPVYMKDDKGNVWIERNYGGYGEFGQKDYYELLAEMNGYTDREEGIKLELGYSGIKHKITHKIYLARGVDFFNWRDDSVHDGLSANTLLTMGDWVRVEVKQIGVLYPILTEDIDYKWENIKPKSCPGQGYFYE